MMGFQPDHSTNVKDGAASHPSPRLVARSLRWTGYGLSFALGMSLWPQLMEWGFKFENTYFGLAIVLNWFCLPVSMTITFGVSSVIMKVAGAVDGSVTPALLRNQIQTASMLGVLATLGSCGMIASGYEPPEPFHSIYELDLTGKYR